MPTLKQLICTVEWSASGPNLPLQEYRTAYSDGLVETYIAIPPVPTPFSIRLKSDGYIAPGLSMFVYIDGQYQCNRGRNKLKIPTSATLQQQTNVDFVVRQKEEPIAGGGFIGRQWMFGGLGAPIGTDAQFGAFVPQAEYTGTIEVVVLRSAELQRAKAPDPTTSEKHPLAFAFGSGNPGALISASESASDFAGLFDGSSDVGERRSSAMPFGGDMAWDDEYYKVDWANAPGADHQQDFGSKQKGNSSRSTSQGLPTNAGGTPAIIINVTQPAAPSPPYWGAKEPQQWNASKVSVADTWASTPTPGSVHGSHAAKSRSRTSDNAWQTWIQDADKQKSGSPQPDWNASGSGNPRNGPQQPSFSDSKNKSGNGGDWSGNNKSRGSTSNKGKNSRAQSAPGGWNSANQNQQSNNTGGGWDNTGQNNSTWDTPQDTGNDGWNNNANYNSNDQNQHAGWDANGNGDTDQDGNWNNDQSGDNQGYWDSGGDNQEDNSGWNGNDDQNGGNWNSDQNNDQWNTNWGNNDQNGGNWNNDQNSDQNGGNWNTDQNNDQWNTGWDADNNNNNHGSGNGWNNVNAGAQESQAANGQNWNTSGDNKGGWGQVGQANGSGPAIAGGVEPGKPRSRRASSGKAAHASNMSKKASVNSAAQKMGWGPSSANGALQPPGAWPDKPPMTTGPFQNGVTDTTRPYHLTLDTTGNPRLPDLQPVATAPAPAPVPPPQPVESANHSYQVHSGEPTLYQHKTASPKYIDTHEKPYAIFIFRYRTKAILEKILNTTIPDSEDVEKAKLASLSKEELIAEVIKIKSRPTSTAPSSAPASNNNNNKVLPPSTPFGAALNDKLAALAAKSRSSSVKNNHQAWNAPPGSPLGAWPAPNKNNTNNANAPPSNGAGAGVENWLHQTPAPAPAPAAGAHDAWGGDDGWGEQKKGVGSGVNGGYRGKDTGSGGVGGW
ncbi:MAG: hypothetical protein LQ344_007608 [Seirophora lacunosa]|nr:MAG: hypothetical protein LQ344_007608 [Seirophora lacunosa]